MKEWLFIKREAVNSLTVYKKVKDDLEISNIHFA